MINERIKSRSGLLLVYLSRVYIFYDSQSPITPGWFKEDVVDFLAGN